MYSKPRNDKDLLFWQKSFEVSVLIIKLSKKLPRELSVKIILNQLLRAIMSIGANIAEGYGRYGSKEYSRFLQISLGSANESEYWLNLLKISCPAFSNEIDLILSKNTETIKMLSKSISTIKKKNKIN